jgi:ribosomal protein L29
MAKTKNTIANKTLPELLKERAEARESLRVLRFEAAGSRPKNSNEPRNVRKAIARIETELSVRRNSAAK